MTEDRRPHATDQGNAQRLVARHGRDLRYCHPSKQWLVWDGRPWAEDQTGEVVRRAKETIRGLFDEALSTEDAATKGALLKFACGSERAERIRAMVTLAQSEPGIAILPQELDDHPWLLN